MCGISWPSVNAECSIHKTFLLVLYYLYNPWFINFVWREMESVTRQRSCSSRRVHSTLPCQILRNKYRRKTIRFYLKTLHNANEDSANVLVDDDDIWNFLHNDYARIFLWKKVHKSIQSIRSSGKTPECMYSA